MRILLDRTDTIDPVEKDLIEEELTMFDKLWDEGPRVQKTKRQACEPEVLDLLIQQVAAVPDANTTCVLLNSSPEAHEEKSPRI